MEVSSYRGLEVKLKADGILVHQTTYTQKVLEAFNMSDSYPADNPMTNLNDKDDGPLDPKIPYRAVIGSLSYLADATRPDIAFAVNQLAQKSVDPTINDWKRAKHLLRYLRGTTKCGIVYQYGTFNEPLLIGYSDSDFAGHVSSSKSTTGYVVMFNGSLIHWKTQLQKHVTTSSTEAEVIALCTLSKELAWIRRMMIELKLIDPQPAVLKCDNQSALRIAQSERFTARTRHLRAQDAYVREQLQYGELILQHVRSDQQRADLLTKNVQTKKFLLNRDMILIAQGVI